MSDLSPSADSPGLRVNLGTRNSAPTGEYACHCGATDTAEGATAVKNLVQAYGDHKAGHAEEARH